MPVEQRKAGRWRQRTKERRKHAPRMSSGLKSVKRNASMQTFNWCSASVGRPGNRSHPLLEPETSLDASADLLWRLTTNWRAECQKLACSVRREGRPHPSSLPLSTLRRRSRRSVTLVRLRVRTNNGVEVPVGQKHWLSVAEGNCVAERRGGEQPEANNQSIIKKMMNSIRPDALASLLGKGEAQNGSRPGKGQRQLRDLDCGEHSERRTGVHGVGGDRMVGSWSDMNQGSLFGKGTAFMTGRGSEEPYPKGDRAFVVAQKRGNARGAKGGRKVETTNNRKKETRTANVLWTQIGEAQREYANLPLVLGVCRPPWEQEPSIARTRNESGCVG